MIQNNFADVVRNLPSIPISQYDTNVAVSRYWDLLKVGLRQYYEISSTPYLSLLFLLAKIRSCDIMQASNFSEADLLAFDKNLSQLENVLFPQIFLIFERLKFYERERHVTETAESYLQTLETLSETCEFGKEKFHRIKQQFVRGGHLHPTLLQLCENALESDLRLILKACGKTDIHMKTARKDTKTRHLTKHEKIGHQKKNLSKTRAQNVAENRIMMSVHSKYGKKSQRSFRTASVPTKHERKEPSAGSNGLKLAHKLSQSVRKSDGIKTGMKASEKHFGSSEIIQEIQNDSKSSGLPIAEDRAKTLFLSSEAISNTESNGVDYGNYVKPSSFELSSKNSSQIEYMNEKNVISCGRSSAPTKCIDEKNVTDEFDKMTCEISHDQGSLLKSSKHGKVQDGLEEMEESDLTQKTGESSPPEWKCKTGDKEFFEQKAFKEHVNSHKCECTVCGRKFNWQSRLSKHMACHTGIKYVPKKRLIGPKPKKGRQHEEYTCQECHAKLNGKREYKKHMRVHECQCDICGKILDCKYSFKLHKDGHIGNKPFKCSHCSRAFTRKSDLTAHLRIHDPGRIKSHVCDFCGKDFFRIHELNRHRRLHTGDKPYGCDVCGKAFPTSYGLKCHRFLHTGIKSFTCDKCGKSFAQKSNLDMHLFRHTGIKEHECSVCGVKFSKKCYLESHIRSHTKEKPHTCEICGACVSSKYSLTRHRLIHSGEKPHVCLICNKSFTWHSTYKKHIENHVEADHDKTNKALYPKSVVKQKSEANYNVTEPVVDADTSMKSTIIGHGSFCQDSINCKASDSVTPAGYVFQKCSLKDLDGSDHSGGPCSSAQKEQSQYLQFHPHDHLPQDSHHLEFSVQQDPQDCSLKDKTAHPHQKQYFHQEQSLQLIRTDEESRRYSDPNAPAKTAYDTIVLNHVTQQ